MLDKTKRLLVNSSGKYFFFLSLAFLYFIIIIFSAIMLNCQDEIQSSILEYETQFSQTSSAQHSFLHLTMKKMERMK
jgi:hypothetical protein